MPVIMMSGENASWSTLRLAEQNVILRFSEHEATDYEESDQEKAQEEAHRLTGNSDEFRYYADTQSHPSLTQGLMGFIILDGNSRIVRAVSIVLEGKQVDAKIQAAT